MLSTFTPASSVLSASASSTVSGSKSVRWPISFSAHGASPASSWVFFPFLTPSLQKIIPGRRHDSRLIRVAFEAPDNPTSTTHPANQQNTRHPSAGKTNNHSFTLVHFRPEKKKIIYPSPSPPLLSQVVTPPQPQTHSNPSRAPPPQKKKWLVGNNARRPIVRDQPTQLGGGRWPAGGASRRRQLKPIHAARAPQVRRTAIRLVLSSRSAPPIPPFVQLLVR
ncbi:hypothetical protein EJ06DRAFT_172801 [Trichodelitschia bisporula]|uniref:Uncharacterized protein n=1 Tax=Trichodelitschia bisporula TaxID=703511 RepID=A0A6G1HM18_9PEZI|nr:hypothetical protein EJ06DRAFT_172801 [Trichodelitschia bisporula]